MKLHNFLFPWSLPKLTIAFNKVACLIGFPATSENAYFNLGTKGNDYKYRILVTCHVYTVSQKKVTHIFIYLVSFWKQHKYFVRGANFEVLSNLSPSYIEGYEWGFE